MNQIKTNLKYRQLNTHMKTLRVHELCLSIIHAAKGIEVLLLAYFGYY
jgi:hypothetical protein